MYLYFTYIDCKQIWNKFVKCMETINDFFKFYFIKKFEGQITFFWWKKYFEAKGREALNIIFYIVYNFKKNWVFFFKALTTTVINIIMNVTDHDDLEPYERLGPRRYGDA